MASIKEIVAVKTEIEILREICSIVSDYLFASTNQGFANFCEQNPDEMKMILDEKISQYEELFRK